MMSIHLIDGIFQFVHGIKRTASQNHFQDLAGPETGACHHQEKVHEAFERNLWRITSACKAAYGVIGRANRNALPRICMPAIGGP